MSTQRALTVLLLMVAALFPVTSQDRPLSYGVAYMINASPGSDASLKQIISSAVALQLARHKATVAAISDSLSEAPPLERSLSAAADKNNQYLLLAVYSTSGREIAIVLQLYDVATSRQIGDASVTGRIDLTLDNVVAQAVEKASVGVEFRQAPEPAVAPAAGSNPTDASGGQVAANQVRTAGSTAETSTLAAGGNTGSGAVARPAAPVRRTGLSLGISTGAAPFLPTGPAGSYVGLGGMATLKVGVKFPLGPGTFGAGVLSGAGSLRAAGVVTDANILLVPVGVDVQYTFNDGGFPGITLHLSGGPAILNVTAAYAGSLTKVIPYLLAGMILDLPFTPYIGMTIEAAWAAFFESMDFPIMGFVPEVSFYVRF